LETVLNWLWQGGVVGLATAALLKGLEPVRAEARCAVLWAAMLCVVGLPLVPLLLAMTAPQAAADARAPLAPAVAMPVTWWTSWSVMLGVWAVWAAVHAGRLASALMALRAAKQRCHPFPREVEARLRCWEQARGQGRRTRLVLSDDVRAAAVLGCGRPVIAVGPSLLEHLNHDDLDRVVIHEWAHVQRHDDLAQIVQFGVRMLAGWHPAVWWLDRRLHVEREVACDEIAVAVTGSARQYAACLATLASLPAARSASLAATPAAATTALESRIVRILETGRLVQHAWRPASAGAAASLAVLGLIVGGLPLVGTEASPIAPVKLPQPEPVALISVASIEASAGASTSPSVRGRQARRRASAAGARLDPTRRETRATERATPPTPSMASVPEGTSAPDVAGLPTMALTSSPLLVPSQPSPHPTVLAARPVIQFAQAPAREIAPASPWRAAADSGVAIGRGAKSAATSTGDFFGRLGGRIAGAF
jgi:beta-lactamase regulating signal transducer with metallopeptidase domain